MTNSQAKKAIQPTHSVHTISISSFRNVATSRQFSLQCSIVMEEDNDFTPPRCTDDPVDLCLSFPAYSPRFHWPLFLWQLRLPFSSCFSSLYSGVIARFARLFPVIIAQQRQYSLGSCPAYRRTWSVKWPGSLLFARRAHVLIQHP